MAEYLSERDILTYLRNKYTVNFNNYQKIFLEKKIACYKKDGKPSDYYSCVRKLDEQMIKNSDFLRSKFGELEVELDKRRSKCKQDFPNFPEKLTQCNNAVQTWYKDSADGLYGQFYKAQVKQ